MSAGTENAKDGGAVRPSGVVNDGEDPFNRIVKQLADIAMGSDGELLPEAEIQIALRSMGGRLKFLDALLQEITPNGVNPIVWTSWLEGGRSPAEPKLKKVGLGDEAPSRTLARATPRVKSQEKKIASIRANLEAEERQLIQMKAHEKAALHWHVADDLISIMAPAFAMGPAWTVMRSLSGYLTDQEVEDLLLFSSEGQGERDIRNHRIRKQNETNRLFAGLDYWSGDSHFESALRSAIEAVVIKFEARREDGLVSGRKRRPMSSIQKTVNPEALNDAEEILKSMDF